MGKTERPAGTLAGFIIAEMKRVTFSFVVMYEVIYTAR